MDIELENQQLASIYRLSLMIQIAAVGVATSFLLIFLPNIETISIISFLLGHYFRRKFYLPTVTLMVVTWEVLASLVFSTSGIMFPFKLLAWIIIALMGDYSRKIGLGSRSELVGLGIISALIYDMMLTIPYAIININTEGGLLLVLYSSFLAGFYFSVLHMVGNAMFFIFTPMIYKSVEKLLEQNFDNLLVKPATTHSGKSSKYAAALLVLLLLTSSLLLFSQNDKEGEVEWREYQIEISYSGIMQNKTLRVSAFSNNTFFDLTNSSFSLQYRFYGRDVYVFGIDNVLENVNITGYYWIFYIDGIRAEKASNQIVTGTSNTILWNYET